MLAPYWLAMTIMATAASILLVICVVSAIRMNLEDVRSQYSSMFIAIATFLIIVGVNTFVDALSLPVLGWLLSFVLAVAGIHLAYSLIVGATIIFRRRFRRFGFRMLVVSAVGIWWMILAEPYYTPSNELPEITTSQTSQ